MRLSCYKNNRSWAIPACLKSALKLPVLKSASSETICLVWYLRCEQFTEIGDKNAQTFYTNYFSAQTAKFRNFKNIHSLISFNLVKRSRNCLETNFRLDFERKTKGIG